MNAMSACFEVVQYAQQHLIYVMQVCLWSLEVQECFLSELLSSAECILSASDTQYTHTNTRTPTQAHTARRSHLEL